MVHALLREMKMPFVEGPPEQSQASPLVWLAKRHDTGTRAQSCAAKMHMKHLIAAVFGRREALAAG